MQPLFVICVLDEGEDNRRLQDQIEYAIAILIDDRDRYGKPFLEDVNSIIADLKKEYPNVTPLIWQKKPSPSRD
jgi:hypothetical protein